MFLPSSESVAARYQPKLSSDYELRQMGYPNITDTLVSSNSVFQTLPG